MNQEYLISLIPFVVGWALPSINTLLTKYKVAQYAGLISNVLSALDPILRDNIDHWGQARVYEEIKGLSQRLSDKPLTDKEVDFVLKHVIKKFDPAKMFKNLRSSNAPY